MSYGNDPQHSKIDAVRFLVGDTDPNAEMVTDQEILFALEQEGQNIYQAAAVIASAISAMFSVQVDKSVGDLQLSFSNRAKQYRDLAAELQRKAAARFTIPYAGGISVLDKRENELAADTVQPEFRRDQFDFPGIGNQDARDLRR